MLHFRPLCDIITHTHTSNGTRSCCMNALRGLTKGLGNLAGEMDFWDVNRKKVMGSTSSHCAVAYGWSPDSRWFLTATCAPRMNVDNDVKVYYGCGSQASTVLCAQ